MAERVRAVGRIGFSRGCCSGVEQLPGDMLEKTAWYDALKIDIEWELVRVRRRAGRTRDAIRRLSIIIASR